MTDQEKSIQRYSELFGRIGRIFYDETTLCIIDAIIKLYFENFIFELSEVVETTNLEKDVVRRSLYSLRGRFNRRREVGQVNVRLTSETFEIENGKKSILEYVLRNFDLKKKYDINNRLEFWVLNPGIKG